ncbi:hypothetical protein [Frateuria sp. Soil773]|uniref:hypothetical protein n=1 Tax=Frateuria sp. Soil773 TaxID=1736407 RepID=UPI0012F7CA21|nr:hypothetical protein [Frateuria sp. Soil773]
MNSDSAAGNILERHPLPGRLAALPTGPAMRKLCRDLFVMAPAPHFSGLHPFG